MPQLDLYHAIIDQYRKFDFKLERCLMTAQTLISFKLAKDKGDSKITTSVEESAIDAIWFSRPSKGDATAWEIRLVSSTPISLLEKIPNNISEFERNEKLKEIELRLIDLISRRKQAIEEIIAENAGADDDDEDDLEEDEFAEDHFEENNPKKPKGNGRYKHDR